MNNKHLKIFLHSIGMEFRDTKQYSVTLKQRAKMATLSANYSALGDISGISHGLQERCPVDRTVFPFVTTNPLQFSGETQPVVNSVVTTKYPARYNHVNGPPPPPPRRIFR